VIVLVWLGVFLGLGWAHDTREPRLTLPPVVYAVQGSPVEIYFANLIILEHTTGLRFVVTSELGRSNDRRWRAEPRRRDIGDHRLEIQLLDENGQLMERAETVVRVSPANAGKDLSVNLLLLGDSLTQAHLYPWALKKRLEEPVNPAVSFLGSNAPAGYPGLRHEGYAGWSWRHFVRRYHDKPFDPAYPQRGSSPFVTKRPGKDRVIDMAHYQQTRLQGAKPDIVVIALGVNDCFSARADLEVYIDRCIDDMLGYSNRLINAFKRQFPKAVIAVSLTQPPNSRYGSFAASYGEKRTRADYLHIWHRVVQRELAHFGDPKRQVAMFPIGLGLDTVDGFEPDNALHPNALGYGQMADGVYAWLKSEFARREGRDVP